MTTTTATFLGGLGGGDEGAWRRFCEHYQEMLLAMARRAALQDEDARDVVQEVLTTVFVEGFQAGRYDRERGRLRSWVQGIAVNKIRETRRRLAKPEIQMADQTGCTRFADRIPDDHELPDLFDEEWEGAVIASCLRQVRGQVDLKTFQAFEQYAFQGRPAEEVAERLGMSRDAVHGCKFRVLKRLRELRLTIEENW